jgi:hypothetical protein
MDVLICHAEPDEAIARTIAGRLERGAEARVWREVCGSAMGETVADSWETGLACSAVLLLLSPEAVPRRFDRARAPGLIDHIQQEAKPALACVLVRSCTYPALLERRTFFRWPEAGAGDPTLLLREIERWALERQTMAGPRQYEPARLGWHAGRDDALDALWGELVDASGRTVVAANAQPGTGKTALVQTFARAARAHFRDIVWVDPGDGISEDDLAHRVLMIVDHAQAPGPPGLLDGPPERRRASVLITSRDVDWPSPARILHLPALPPGARRTYRPSGPGLRLWQAFAAFGAAHPRLDSVAGTAGMTIEEAGREVEQLVAAGCLDPFDAEGTRFRLNAFSRDAAMQTPGWAAFARQHALEVLHGPRNPVEWRRAFDWALSDDWTLAQRLAGAAWTHLAHRDGTAPDAEALIFVQESLMSVARAHGDALVVRACGKELSWLNDETQPVGPALPPGAQLSLAFGAE